MKQIRRFEVYYIVAVGEMRHFRMLLEQSCIHNNVLTPNVTEINSSVLFC